MTLAGAREALLWAIMEIAPDTVWEYGLTERQERAIDAALDTLIAAAQQEERERLRELAWAVMTEIGVKPIWINAITETVFARPRMRETP